MLLITTTVNYGQLGFCNGSKGDAIFFENFGDGTDFGPALLMGVTSYAYIAGTPEDGQYTLYHRTNLNGSWHNAPNHTPDNTATVANGKSLIVNASFTAGEFYKRTVRSLCVNTTFEFTAWVMNVYNAASNACAGSGIPVNITFEIWDITETTLLKSGSTGDINGTNLAQWRQYGLTFTTLPGQTEVVLKIKNNGVGGCGNDLAIDDIMFRSCGDIVTLTSPQSASLTYTVCEDQAPVNVTLNLDISNATPHVFQWQQSPDNTTWTDIAGENNATLSVSNITTNTFYRVKVAQDAANLANAFCFTVSDIFSVAIIPKPTPPVSNGNIIICSNEIPPPIGVLSETGISIDWFDAAVGGNLLLSNSAAFLPVANGSYFAEAYIQGSDCRSATRTEVTFTINPSPEVTDEALILCETKTLLLDAGIDHVDYVWQPNGEITKTIAISEPGTYAVTVTNAAGCSEVKTITVTENLIPIITNVITEHATVTIVTAIAGAYEYSIDGIYYQTSNVFTEVTGGLKTAYAREINDCGEDFEDFLLILAPAYFTPNGDGFHDFFTIPGLEQIPNSKVSIFDRYGKLIIVLTPEKPFWDGKLNGKLLPSTDYWYRGVFENGQQRNGHFSLKR